MLDARRRVGGLVDDIGFGETPGDVADLAQPTAEVGRVIGAVARGDLSQSMAVELDGRALDGEFLRTARIVNTMVDQLRSFAAEVTRVAREVGTEGKLGGQADVRGVAGTWKDLTDSVNSMAGNLTSQVRNIAAVTTAVANGDLSKKITVDVKGEILELKNTINTMVDQLNSFAAQVTRVAREVGTEGKLGGQAEVKGVAGTWKDLTDSVNAGTFSISVEMTPGMTIDQYVDAVNAASGGKISASYDDVAGQFTYLINDPNFDDLAVSSDGTDGTNLGDGVATTTVSSAGSNTFTVSGFDFSLTGAILSPLASTDISVSTAAATTASNAIDTAITSLNQSLATMGSQAAALDIQNDFLSKLSDTIEQGIGNLVDADLAKESARLQSLQIKQQLGAQALSIANQAPSLILSFFR